MDFYLQYSFESTVRKNLDRNTGEKSYTTRTGTIIDNGIGVWGRVVLDENGNVCEEGTDITLKDRIYCYRLSTKI